MCKSASQYRAEEELVFDKTSYEDCSGQKIVECAADALNLSVNLEDWEAAYIWVIGLFRKYVCAACCISSEVQNAAELLLLEPLQQTRKAHGGEATAKYVMATYPSLFAQRSLVSRQSLVSPPSISGYSGAAKSMYCKLLIKVKDCSLCSNCVTQRVSCESGQMTQQ